MKRFILLALMLTMTSICFALPILGDITGNPAHTEADTGDELYRLTDIDGGVDDATAFLLFEFAGFDDINSFGIYDGANSLEVFSGLSSVVTSATLAWDTLSDLVLNQVTGATAFIDDQLFGFYLDSGDGNTYYSESALNGGLDMMVSYDVGGAGYPDLFGSNIVIAFEDLSVGSDWDYNDMVVGLSDIAPAPTSVPEPMPLALMGLGLLGMIGASRRNRR